MFGATSGPRVFGATWATGPGADFSGPPGEAGTYPPLGAVSGVRSPGCCVCAPPGAAETRSVFGAIP